MNPSTGVTSATSPDPILLLDPDPRLPPLLGAGLSRPVQGCRTVEEFEERAREGVAFALGEVEIRGGLDGIRALGRLRRDGVPVALWTSTAVDGLLPPAREEGIGLLLTKTQPLLLEELSMAVALSETGWSPGLGKYLGTGACVLGQESAGSLAQVASLCRHVQDGLDGILRTGRRLRLVLDELLSNAIHHSPGAGAVLEWGKDSVRHVFVVRDEAGTLSPPEVLRLLDRHLRAEGLLDPRGRGIHLSRIYADRLYATVVPGRVTEFAAVFWNTPGTYEGFKPVWLLETKFAGKD